jgi:hypothetical protein
MSAKIESIKISFVGNHYIVFVSLCDFASTDEDAYL